jgi:hypothetical protein
LSRDMGHRVMICVGTPGGAPCPGDTPHPWTRRPHASPTTGEARSRARSCANSPTSVVRRATRGSRAIAHMAREAWRNAHASRIPAPITRPGTWSMPALHGAVIPLPGAPRTGGPCARHGSRAGRDRRAPRSASSSAAMASCPRHDAVDRGAIRGRPPASSWRPPRGGAPTSTGRARRATDATALRSPWPMATAACGLAVKRARPPEESRPRPCASACATRAVCPRASAPRPGCPGPPTPSAGAHPSPPGGSAWASSRNASSPVHPSHTAAMRAGIVPAQLRPSALRRPRGAPHTGHASAAATHAPARAPTQPSRGNPRPHAMRSLRVRGPPHGPRWRLRPAARGAPSAPMGASGGSITGATAPTPAWAKRSAARTSTRVSGLSIAVRSHVAGGSHDPGASRRPLGDSPDADACDPCLRTLLFPISPAGHSACQPALAFSPLDLDAAGRHGVERLTRHTPVAQPASGTNYVFRNGPVAAALQCSRRH